MPIYQPAPPLPGAPPAEFFPSVDPFAYQPAGSGSLAAGYVDVSLESPEQQQTALAGILEAFDEIHPAPFTGTPPWGESIDTDEYIPLAVQEEEFMPAADVESAAAAELLSLTRDAFPADQPAWTWYNDDQYHGLGVPPGVPNWDQPIETGHSQIILQNPGAEHGWDAWSGKPDVARVARHENNFPGYSKGVNRKLGTYSVEKMVMPYVLLTQQYRDLLFSELYRRGIHNVVVADVPSVPFTEQVVVTDPTMLMPEAPIGPEGVLPW